MIYVNILIVKIALHTGDNMLTNGSATPKATI